MFYSCIKVHQNVERKKYIAIVIISVQDYLLGSQSGNFSNSKYDHFDVIFLHSNKISLTSKLHKNA